MAYFAAPAMNHGLVMPLPPAELIDLLRIHAAPAGFWRLVSYAKRQRIDVREDGGPWLLVVERGLVKLSYVTGEGDERIKSFITAPGLFDQNGAVVDPAIEATCLEPAEVVALPLTWVRTVASSDCAVQRAVDAFWLWLSAKKRARESALLCSTPLQRFCRLQTDEPALVERLSQGDIARYIGITPIAFSRLKRRVQSDSALSS